METSFYFMYYAPELILHFDMCATELKPELKLPGTEFRLKFPHSWPAENLLMLYL